MNGPLLQVQQQHGCSAGEKHEALAKAEDVRLGAIRPAHPGGEGFSLHFMTRRLNSALMHPAPERLRTRRTPYLDLGEGPPPVLAPQARPRTSMRQIIRLKSINCSLRWHSRRRRR
ncbi:hypothetical protein MLD38_013666 [Melastoma candidum]|uniref:Uncharacterized protein n=1 Tax=Melastoma candidum TaxID=119954 RepID=A0ACB9RDF0_9MYRT|nr:hypothetical protein MLD38_013666 [Melastoma candidum]